MKPPLNAEPWAMPFDVACWIESERLVEFSVCAYGPQVTGTGTVTRILAVRSARAGKVIVTAAVAAAGSTRATTETLTVATTDRQDRRMRSRSLVAINQESLLVVRASQRHFHEDRKSTRLNTSQPH